MRKITTILLTLAFLFIPVISIEAAVYTNPSNNYEVILQDDADLLTDSQEKELIEEMKEITQYGNVAFASISSNPEYSTARYIEKYYHSLFGTDSGTVFLIDMDNRNIWIFSDGAIYKRITDSYADTITDNVYTYASDGDYFTCSLKVYEQINTLLAGGRIAQPMKYISNLLLAIILAFILNFFIVMWYSRSRKASTAEVMSGIYHNVDIKNANKRHTHQTKKYDPPSSSSSGGGGGGRSGGGGSSGGGGGHSF